MEFKYFKEGLNIIKNPHNECCKSIFEFNGGLLINID